MQQYLYLLHDICMLLFIIFQLLYLIPWQYQGDRYHIYPSCI